MKIKSINWIYISKINQIWTQKKQHLLNQLNIFQRLNFFAKASNTSSGEKRDPPILP